MVIGTFAERAAAVALLRAFGLGVALCSIAAAQQRIDCRDALDNLERFAGKDTGNVQPPARLQRALLSLSGLLKKPMMAMAVVREGSIQFDGFVQGRADLTAAVTSVLAQL